MKGEPKYKSGCKGCQWIGDEYVLINGKARLYSFFYHDYPVDGDGIIAWKGHQRWGELPLLGIENEVAQRTTPEQDFNEIGLTLYYKADIKNVEVANESQDNFS